MSDVLDEAITNLKRELEESALYQDLPRQDPQLFQRILALLEHMEGLRIDLDALDDL